MDRLSKARVQVYAFPVAVRGLEAFPVRVIAVEED
jgi:kynurenine formamidase